MTINDATRQFVRQHTDDDVRLLALQAHATAGIDLPWALDQIRGRQVARRKVPSWAAVDGIVYPPHLSMEQCSSEPTARYKAQLVRRLLDGTAPSPAPLFADLTGGFGVDFSLMAQAARGWRTVYVERNPQLCDLARHNLPLLGLGDAEVVCATADEFLAARLQEGVGDCLFYLDPAHLRAGRLLAQRAGAIGQAGGTTGRPTAGAAEAVAHARLAQGGGRPGATDSERGAHRLGAERV